MHLIPTTPPPAREAQDDIADEFCTQINAEFGRRIEEHKRLWAVLWLNPSATPAQIVAALGPRAAGIFAASRANVQHLAACAALAGGDLASIGLADFVQPPLEVTIHPDGTVTLAPPADGFDAWGRQLNKTE